MAEIEEIETNEIGMLDFDPDKELLNAPCEVTTAA